MRQQRCNYHIQYDIIPHHHKKRMNRGGGTRQWATTTITIIVYCIFVFVFQAAVVSTTGLSALLGRAQQRGDDHHAAAAAAAATTVWTRPSSTSNDVCNNEVNDKTTTTLEEAERQLLFFLKSNRQEEEDEERQEEEEEEFHIHGWRWHTMSLIREATRLKRTAEKLMTQAATVADHSKDDDDDENWADLIKAADYVVNFNMRGLHKIETTLFFPWARQRIISQLTTAASATAAAAAATTTTMASSASRHQQVQSQHHQQEQQQVTTAITAFGTIMNYLESQRETVEQLGVQLTGLLSSSTSSSSSSSTKKTKNEGLNHDLMTIQQQLHILDRVASTSNAIVQYTQNMLDMEEALLVPIVARLVPAAEQKSFNNKVIINLGVLDSRLHLVGMHQAVYYNNCALLPNNNNDSKKNNKNKKEQHLFEQVIPSIPQRMIPRWKRLLYDPQVAIFQRILHDE